MKLTVIFGKYDSNNVYPHMAGLLPCWDHTTLSLQPQICSAPLRQWADTPVIQM